MTEDCVSEGKSEDVSTDAIIGLRFMHVDWSNFFTSHGWLASIPGNFADR